MQELRTGNGAEFMRRRGAWGVGLAFGTVAAILLASNVYAQMDLSLVSGQPLPSPDVPIGTMTVRVIRGSLTNNVAGQAVDVTIDGATRTFMTDANGRAEVTGLKPGAHVKAVTVVDGERIESKDITIGGSGLRVMLVATDKNAPKAAPGAPANTAAGPPVKGSVAFGPESRIVAEFVQDRLNVYYLMDVVNASASPVDIGGPLLLDLPREARSAGLMDDTSKQATVNGPRVTVLGPFAPGTTKVRVGFELPVGGGTAHVESKLPAGLPQLIVIVAQTGGLGLVSPQIGAQREVTDEGQRIVVGTGPALAAGQNLSFDITGVPHHPLWPRYVALALAGSLMTAGIWAAAVARPPRRRS